jgi:hypothetical protein
MQKIIYFILLRKEPRPKVDTEPTRYAAQSPDSRSPPVALTFTHNHKDTTTTTIFFEYIYPYMLLNHMKKEKPPL